ncbi:MAG: glycosyltransferase [Pseudomonadota bacterium]
MAKRGNHSRVLVYSHDTFGLGHLRRCRAIGHALVARHSEMSVLILSGSPIIGSFDFRSRVDFIRVPGVIKLRNGEYTSLNLHIDTEETLAMRTSIIEHTAEIFDPDLFIVDKEPLGLRGEVKGTLQLMRDRGTPTVLGLRDVMDEPALLAPEWERKKVLPALEDLYDHIWIYGLRQICDPLEGIDVPASVGEKTAYTGYLRRTVPQAAWATVPPIDGDYILVTPGGGGDGEVMVDWVLRAYEADNPPDLPAVIVLGPFMSAEAQAGFVERAAQLASIEILTFDNKIERLIHDAVGVVAMGGYNTFCEILSFDKRAVLIPRTKPRLEQHIRATRAAALGLVTTLSADNGTPTDVMTEALRKLPTQQKPSEAMIPGMMGGLDVVDRLVQQIIHPGAPIADQVRYTA